MDRKESGLYTSGAAAGTYPTWTEPEYNVYNAKPRNQPFIKHHGNHASENRKQKTSSPKSDELQRMPRGKTADITSSSNMTRGRDKGPIHRSSSIDAFSFETTLKEGFVLKAYSASVTRVNVDAIVNAANDVMSHGGGVAKVISDAAGDSLDKESKRYVNTYGPVEVSKNIVTTAGRLPYKAVIHAVGPEWHNYRDKVTCLDDLFDCVYNVLETCKKKRYKTVALTAISAGIFGVPKELCADMYVYAATNFSKTLLKSQYPRELHIIDVDVRILQYVEESVKRLKMDSLSLNPRITIPKFLKENPQLAGFSNDKAEDRGQSADQRDTLSSEEGRKVQSNGIKQGGRSESSRELVSNVARIEDHKFSWGGFARQFVVDQQITVKIYKGDISRVRNMDAIVCGIGKDLEPKGSIANALNNAGGDVYVRSCQRMMEKHSRDSVNHSDVFKCEGGNLGAKYVTHAVVKTMVEANAREVEAYQDCIACILLKAKRNEWKRMAIPMIGTGNIQTNKRKLSLCGTALLKALDEFVMINGDRHELNEIHLVNYKNEICDVLEEVFNDAADCQAVTSTRKSSHLTNSSTSHYLASSAARGGADAKQGKGHYKRKSYHTESLFSSSNADTTSGRGRVKDGGSSKKKDFFRSNHADETLSDKRERSNRPANQRASTRKFSDYGESAGNLTIIDY